MKLSECNWDFDLALDCSNSDCHLSSSNSCDTDSNFKLASSSSSYNTDTKCNFSSLECCDTDLNCDLSLWEGGDTDSNFEKNECLRSSGMVILPSPKTVPIAISAHRKWMVLQISSRKQKLKRWDVNLGYCESYLKWKLNKMRLTLDMRQAGGDWLPMANLMHICFFVFEFFLMQSLRNYCVLFWFK